MDESLSASSLENEVVVQAVPVDPTAREILASETAIRETQEEELTISVFLITLWLEPTCHRPPRGSMW